VLGSNGTEKALKLSAGSLLGHLGRVSERPKLSALNRIGQSERVRSARILMSGGQPAVAETGGTMKDCGFAKEVKRNGREKSL
jgi:hypothetical protein